MLLLCFLNIYCMFEPLLLIASALGYACSFQFVLYIYRYPQTGQHTAYSPTESAAQKIDRSTLTHAAPAHQSSLGTKGDITSNIYYQQQPLDSTCSYMSTHQKSPRPSSQDNLGDFRMPSTEEVLADQLNGTHITVQRGDSFSTGFISQSPDNQKLSPTQTRVQQLPAAMNGQNHQQVIG